MAEGVGRSGEDVARAESEVTRAFRCGYQDLVRGRPEARPRPSDDQAVFALADQVVRECERRMSEEPSLPRLSRAQLVGVRQRLFLAHSALGPLAEMLSLPAVEDVVIASSPRGWLEFRPHRPASAPSEAMEE